MYKDCGNAHTFLVFVRTFCRVVQIFSQFVCILIKSPSNCSDIPFESDDEHVWQIGWRLSDEIIAAEFIMLVPCLSKKKLKSMTKEEIAAYYEFHSREKMVPIPKPAVMVELSTTAPVTATVATTVAATTATSSQGSGAECAVKVSQ